MKNLPPIYGLRFEAATCRKRATELARRLRVPSKCPRAAHELEVEADQQTKIAGELDAIADDDVEIIDAIELLISRMAGSKFKTPVRTLALRALEAASDRLRREVGSAE